ncbi:hypothetical protein NQ317_013705 [Molorchus minor]|uniref:Uncharacterized protein n=1 Tax=Molorchus minor TaxID=1323400 RepID=A0ABQ9JF09_9CUCU|nr:hypothetical protein NQ317_013705 [Molorchus minor]
MPTHNTYGPVRSELIVQNKHKINLQLLFKFMSVFSAPKTVQATVTLLENLHIILEKTPRDDIRNEVLPMLYNAFESTTIQVQIFLSIFELVKDTAQLRYQILVTDTRYAGPLHCFFTFRYLLICTEERRNIPVKIMGKLKERMFLL